MNHLEQLRKKGHRRCSSHFLTGLFFLLPLLLPSAAQAYCVYNVSSYPITVAALPVTFSSFKAAIPDGERRCCHWSECTSGGQFGKTTFAIYDPRISPSEIGWDQVFSWAEVIADVYQIYEDCSDANLVDEFVENVEAELHYVFPGNADFGEPTYVSDMQKFKRDFEQALSLPDKDWVQGYGTTYNGGVLYVDLLHAWGCWTGPCLGPNISSDGQTGYPGNFSACPPERQSDGGCCNPGTVAYVRSSDSSKACCDPAQVCGGSCGCPSDQFCSNNACRPCSSNGRCPSGTDAECCGGFCEQGYCDPGHEVVEPGTTTSSSTTPLPVPNTCG